ncbi:unnamed protein product [Orchesella dallaii]|uniref:Uncharacterized protein n=1 Tax=Orchesella dallaii TaxID=48710 RepID=A0ABP1Q9P8_9HEXA
MAVAPVNRGSAFDRPGFAFVCKALVERSRANFDLILLIPKHLNGNNLVQLLQDAIRRKQKVFYGFDAGADTRLMLQSDRSVASFFRIFVQTIHPPFDLANFNYRRWAARLLLPHLLLSAANYKWRGLSCSLVFRHGEKSVMTALLKFFWAEVLDEVHADLRLIQDNLDNVFCVNCQPNCPLSNLPSHFQISRFDELEFASDLVPHRIFMKLRLFGSSRPIGDERMLDLYQFNQEVGEFSLQALNNASTRVNTILANDEAVGPHCCYLVLILQGSALEHIEDDIAGLLARSHVTKLLYVGVTRGENLRSDHLTDRKSPVFKVLSKCAQVFVLRRFVTDSRIQAERNEAFVIEILKTIIAKKVDRKERLPFLLLNQQSSTSALLGVDEETLHQIIDFVELERPVFSATSTTEDLTHEPNFEGDYSLLNRRRIRNATILRTTYVQIRDNIDQAESRSKNARFFNY